MYLMSCALSYHSKRISQSVMSMKKKKSVEEECPIQTTRIKVTSINEEVPAKDRHVLRSIS